MVGQRKELRVAEAEELPILPILQVGTEQAFTGEECVYVLTRYLAGNCDGAHRPDGVGFNRVQTAFGHQMAEQPFRYWTPRQTWAMYRVLQTYKNTQLAPWWDLVPEIPEPVNPNAQREAEYAEWRRKKEPTYEPPKQFRKMVTTTINGQSFIELQQNYDPGLIERIKMLPQRRYLKERQCWVVPIHLDALEAVTSFAMEYGYEIEPEVEAAITETMDAFAARIELSHASDGEYQIALPPGLELYPFQKIGVQYAEQVGNVLIADQMGLGKTVQGLMTVAVTHSFPTIVLCPASLKHNWFRETQKWIPGKRVAILNGGQSQPLTRVNGDPMFDVVIINYDILGKWMEELTLLKPKALIADECHAVKSPKAQRTKNVKVLIDACPGMRRIFLSGTPVVNRPMEFWTLISLLGYSKEMGGLIDYKRRYENAWQSRLHELNTRARTYFMIRRLKVDVLKELPDKQRTMVPIDIDNRKEYDAAVNDIAGYFATKKIQGDEYDAVKMSLMAQAISQGMLGDEGMKWVNEQMRTQFGADYSKFYLIAAQNEELLRWEALKQLAVEGKMAGVYAWLDEFMESDEKVVVFGLHTSVIERIARRYNAPYIHGSVKIEHRQYHVDRFQTDPKCRMIVGNMQAMGEGLTLTAASNVAFVEYGWNPKTHDQAEDRCHRIGQKDAVMIWNLTAEDTIDEELAAMIEKKRMVADAIQDGAGVATQMEMMRELRETLGKKLGRVL